MGNVEVTFVAGMTFVGKGESNHWVIMDGAPEVGGTNAGSRPTELLLIGLGGCSGMDVVSILRKKRIKYDRFEIKISSERSEQHPKVFTKIHVEYILYGKDISEKDFTHSVELSQEKYCSVAGVLKNSGAVMTFSHRIVQ